MIAWCDEVHCHNYNTIEVVLIVAILQEEEEGFKMAPSNFVPTINEGSEKYASKSL